MSANTIAANGHVTSRLPPLGLTPEQAARKHARRVNVRVLAGVACVLVAFTGFLLITAASSPRTHGVLVATRDLPAGTRLRRADVAVAQAQLGEAQARTFISAEALASTEGQVLLSPVAAQQIVARTQLATSPQSVLQPGFVRMTVPVRPDTAVGGALRPGDTVSVLSTVDKGKPTAQNRVVLDRVLVDQVGQADTLGGTGLAAAGDAATAATTRPTRPITWVTLQVPEASVSSLSLARWNGELELIQIAPFDTFAAIR
jgi:Flp pilus assembly protein CpaB